MSKRAINVYGIGNAIMDLQVSISEDEFSKLGLEKSSMNLVEAATQQQILAGLANTDLHRASGGSAANTIIALAELGASTAYCCLVGDDQFGKDYLSELRSLGVTTHVAPAAGETTGTSLILITPDAERTMNTHLGVSATLSPQHLDAELIAQSDWLYVEGYLFASPSGSEAALRAIEIAKASQVKVAITFSDAFIVEVFGEALRKAVADAELVFANVREAQAYTGATSAEECFSRLAAEVPMVALTMSSEGALVGTSESIDRITAPAVTEVDATGAGDMFAGGFLFALTQGMSLKDAGDLACRLGSEVVAQLGPRLKGNLRRFLA